MRTIFISVFIVLAFAACEKDKPQSPTAYIQVAMQPVFGDQEFYMDSIYTTPQGYKVKFSELKCYFTLFTSNGASMYQAALFDYRENGNLLFKLADDYKKHTQLSMVLGVDSSLNHLDPSAFANNNPLNISNAGPMHWGWNTGYIFINVEGKVDTIPDANLLLDHSFSFHIGTDSYAQDLQWDNISWTDIGNHTHEFKLKLDLLAFLNQDQNSIDLKNEYLTHTASGQQALTQKVASNFKHAIITY